MTAAKRARSSRAKSNHFERALEELKYHVDKLGRVIGTYMPAGKAAKKRHPARKSVAAAKRPAIRTSPARKARRSSRKQKPA